MLPTPEKPPAERGDRGPYARLARAALAALAVCALVRWLVAPHLGRAGEGSWAYTSASGGMDCGRAAVCGVLALETGLGKSYYHHNAPAVHGLWPQVPPYGNSPCVAPVSKRPPNPSLLPACYSDPAVNPDHQESFVRHEWEKHGVCAGAASEQAYFMQICALSAAPLGVMAKAEAAGASLAAIARAVAAAGFPVHSVDTFNSQLLLSACGVANADGAYSWKLAAVSQFGAVCGAAAGGGARAPQLSASPAPAPATASGGAACEPNARGPRCASSEDCSGLGGCVRCARSGYCTSVPYP